MAWLAFAGQIVKLGARRGTSALITRVRTPLNFSPTSSPQSTVTLQPASSRRRSIVTIRLLIVLPARATSTATQTSLLARRNSHFLHCNKPSLLQSLLARHSRHRRRLAASSYQLKAFVGATAESCYLDIGTPICPSSGPAPPGLTVGDQSIFMTMATSKYDRGIRGDDKGLTSVRIRYSSPPPREDDETLQVLTRDRGLGGFRPRHTPLDACAAQDVALGKARILDLAIRSTQTSRRDSGINDHDTSEKTTKKSDHDSDNEAHEEDYAVKPPPLPSKAAARLSIPPRSLLPARAPSPKRPFSEVSSPSTAPAEEPRPRPPPPESAKSATPSLSSSPASHSRAGRGRKTAVRPSELRNLSVDAEGLDPTRQEPVVKKLYLSKGKWYEVTGPGRPDWAEDEREEIISAAPSTTKRARTSMYKYAF